MLNTRPRTGRNKEESESERMLIAIFACAAFVPLPVHADDDRRISDIAIGDTIKLEYSDVTLLCSDREESLEALHALPQHRFKTV